MRQARFALEMRFSSTYSPAQGHVGQRIVTMTNGSSADWAARCVSGGQSCVTLPEQLRELPAGPEGCRHRPEEHRRGQQEAAGGHCESGKHSRISH